MANELLARIPGIVRDLEEAKAQFALIGGFALLAHGIDRPRKDIDFAVSVPNDQVAERLVLYLQKKGYQAVQAFEHRTTGRLTGVRFLLPHSSSKEPECDLLFGTSGIEDEVVHKSIVMELDGQKVPVASRSYLMALKTLADRSQDRQDLVELIIGADSKEQREVAKALHLIKERDKTIERDIFAVWSVAQEFVKKLDRDHEIDR